MSKFVLRNLRNERRRIEKQLESIDEKIDRVKNTKVIMEGFLDLTSQVRIDKTDIEFLDKKAKFCMGFKVKMERFNNEVICTLSSDAFYFRGKQFVGKAVCLKEDKFDLATGMTIAQNKAVRDVYSYIIKVFE